MGQALVLCQGSATQSASQPESPEGRGLKRTSTALRRLKRATAIPCATRLVSARFRSRRAHKRLFRGSLVSHWRPLSRDVNFGTPCDWLLEHFEKVIEINVSCPIEKAAHRYKQRVRHKGHLDDSIPLSALIDYLKNYEQYLPIGLGKLFTVDCNVESKESFRALVAGIETYKNNDVP